MAHANAPGTDSRGNALDYFDCCRRVTESERDEAVPESLKDDLQAILSGQAREFHRKYHCPHGTARPPFLIRAKRLNLPGVAFRVLITQEELEQGEDLHDSDGELAQLLDNTNVIEWEAEIQGTRFTHVTSHAVKMLGYPATAWYEANFLAKHIHREDRRRVLVAYRNQTRVANDFVLTFRMVNSDGHLVWVRNLVSVKETTGVGRMHGFMIDISERKRAEETLRDLGGRLIAAQEEERKRVARELHDDLNQRMAVLSIELEQLVQKTQKPINFRERVKKLQVQAQEISTVIHHLSYKLHPSKLDHLGLATAVRSLCDEMSQNDKPKIVLHEIDIPAELPKEVKLCIFRIAQEVLRNCVKHSGADSVQVILRKTDDNICLSVSDNGRGFDPDSEESHKGLGLISMEERLRIVGGEMSIWSQPMCGTRIDVSVPLSCEIEHGPKYSDWSDPLGALAIQ
jgi:PAS domain S-box-containing protein